MSTPLVPNKDQVALFVKLKQSLQREERAGKLESLSAALIGRLLEVPVFVARSGFQHGGDAGPAGHQQRRFRIEAKKYADSTTLKDRELLGELDQALAADEGLEAWILVATRAVPEQLANQLVKHGERLGVPVVIMDWPDYGMSHLAALCAWAPDIVEQLYSAEAAGLAREFAVSKDAVDDIRRNLQTWSMGFADLRRRSHEKLGRVWTSPRVSGERLGQNAAGGAQPRKVKRERVHAALDSWWTGPAMSDAPVVVTGWDGVGKTWSTVEWLVDRRESQPIIVVVPSSAAAAVTAVSETSLKTFLASRLLELTGVRDPEYWFHRLERLLKRPAEEGPALTVFFDGLNQEPSVPWVSLLKVFQAEVFQGRVRVIVSTRSFHLEDRLSSLKGLVVPAVMVQVDPFDAAPGGELDAMLKLEGLPRSDLHPDLIEMARTPRLFSLVMRFRSKLAAASQVTVHRLLWEYGRDTAGVRAGVSFSEADWREWLREVAAKYREGAREWSIRGLGETAARPDLPKREVFARLSDIIDGRFMMPGSGGCYVFTPTVTAHALGTALLARLEVVERESGDPDAELTAWLDPIAGLDERAEILRAAVSIFIEQGSASPPVFAGPLVTAWLQTQNVPDQHRRELCALATDLVSALLYALEHSPGSAQASARTWAVHALRAIPRADTKILSVLVSSIRRWFSYVPRDLDPRGNPEFECHRSRRLISHIGIDRAGPITVLGVPLELIDHSNATLLMSAPPILEGFPLARAMPVFEAAAIALAIRGLNPAWDALKWLCLLNQTDPDEMARALRALSADVKTRVPEPGIHVDLAARTAALLLKLTGHEADEDAAADMDPSLDHILDYETGYLGNPGASWYPLERRHAHDVLLDTSLTVRHRMMRTKKFWLDPSFEFPAAFADEVRTWATSIDVSKLDRHLGYTFEEHNFDEMEVLLARCDPEMLADVLKRKLRTMADCPDEARYSSAIRAPRHILVAGREEATCAQTLRMKKPPDGTKSEWFAQSQLLAIELQDKLPREQFATVIEADLEHILLSLGAVLVTPSPQEVDELISRFRHGTDKERLDLLALLSSRSHSLTATAWEWLEECARAGRDVARGFAFKILATADSPRFARTLLSWDWSWSVSEHVYTNDYGSGAIIEGAFGVPFDQIAPRIAPWRLLEAARRRGGDPNEVRLAATVLAAILRKSEALDVPDLGVDVSVDLELRGLGPLHYLVEPLPSLDDASYQRAMETAVARINRAHANGAHMYLYDVDARDLELVVRTVPEVVDAWVAGAAELSVGFRRRIALAEGIFVGLCEVLLKHQPERGAQLWRALRAVAMMKHIGAAGLDELVHILFRAPDSAFVAQLRDELLKIECCNSDESLFNLALAAAVHGQAAWLERTIDANCRSTLAWRRKLGRILDAFRVGNELPVPSAWPEGEVRTHHEMVSRKSAESRWRDACARFWWREYLSASESAHAYASWVLFIHSADRRAWTWMKEEMAMAKAESDLFKRKMLHLEVNLSDLKRAMKEAEKDRDFEFLMRRTVGTIGPWRTEPS